MSDHWTETESFSNLVDQLNKRFGIRVSQN